MQVTDYLFSVNLALRLQAALKFFEQVPVDLQGLGRPHHVGFIADGQLLELIHAGFALTEVYDSQKVARELGVATTVHRYQRGDDTIEVFIPAASHHLVNHWIRTGRALHVAFRVEDVSKGPVGWKPQGEPVAVKECMIQYYSRPNVGYRLELFRCS